MNKMKNHTFYILINFREKGEKYGPDFEKKPGEIGIEITDGRKSSLISIISFLKSGIR